MMAVTTVVLLQAPVVPRSLEVEARWQFSLLLISRFKLGNRSNSNSSKFTTNMWSSNKITLNWHTRATSSSSKLRNPSLKFTFSMEINSMETLICNKWVLRVIKCKIWLEDRIKDSITIRNSSSSSNSAKEVSFRNHLWLEVEVSLHMNKEGLWWAVGIKMIRSSTSRSSRCSSKNGRWNRIDKCTSKCRMTMLIYNMVYCLKLIKLFRI